MKLGLYFSDWVDDVIDAQSGKGCFGHPVAAFQKLQSRSRALGTLTSGPPKAAGRRSIMPELDKLDLMIVIGFLHLAVAILNLLS